MYSSEFKKFSWNEEEFIRIKTYSPEFKRIFLQLRRIEKNENEKTKFARYQRNPLEFKGIQANSEKLRKPNTVILIQKNWKEFEGIQTNQVYFGRFKRIQENAKGYCRIQYSVKFNESQATSEEFNETKKCEWF